MSSLRHGDGALKPPTSETMYTAEVKSSCIKYRSYSLFLIYIPLLTSECVSKGSQIVGKQQNI